MVENYKQWHEKLPFGFLGYRTTIRILTRATPYLLVYGSEVGIAAEVEIPSLRIIQEVELSDAEWSGTVTFVYQRSSDGIRIEIGSLYLVHGQSFQCEGARARHSVNHAIRRNPKACHKNCSLD
uniref:Uncharacterized protein LOC104249692 n=1 Tax=Nicotiana sylvestris TaxID=4096 RepID=A0A1U7YZA5_NICSY|nr:PREDICTED: uncharacterized protein LOC104249692 [Nicotiana sylvestris]